MTIIKRLYSSIILLILGGLIIKTQIVFGDYCRGFSDAIIFTFLCTVYFSLLIIFLLVSAVKSHRKKVKFNYFPLLTTLFLSITIYVAISQQDKFESPTTLYATTTSTSHGHEQCSLTLRENKTFKIRIQEIEWACFYNGDFKISGDTLRLERHDIQTRTDSVFSENYFIDKSKKTLYPLDNIQDTARWLTIADDKK